MKRTVAGVVAIVLVSCSGASQSEYDELEASYTELRDEIAERDREAADLSATDSAILAYVAATDPLDLAALESVYAPDLEVFDAARGLTFRTRDVALLDLASGASAYGIIRQRTLSMTVSPGQAAVVWEYQGQDDIGSDWSFRGVSIIEVVDGLITHETLYYDPTDAPWGR